MKKFFLFLLFLTLFYSSFPQRSTYKLTYYSPRDYGKGLEEDNLAIVQNKSGVLYFGNAGGLLQYDGVNWSFIPVKNKSLWIESLAVSEDDVIYVGAQNEFGYLSPDESGKLKYVSLSDQLINNKIPFPTIIRVLTWKNGVAFQYEEAIFVFSEGKLATILPETSFHISFILNNEFYVRQRGVGIMKLERNELKLAEGSRFLKDIGVFSILESSDLKKYVIITRDNGFWSVDKNTFRGSPIRTPDSILLKKSQIYGAIRLTDGRIALNTLSNGIIITDDTFKIISVINKGNGQNVSQVLSLLQDYQGNIWGGLDNGIVHIQYSSPVSVFGPETGISGNVKAIVRYKGNLFVGTTSGLFVQNNDYTTSSAAFIPFKGFSKEIRDICKAGDCLLVGTMDELFEIRSNDIQKIDNIEVNALHFSEKLKTLFVSGKKNLILYEFSGKWKKYKDINEVTEKAVRFEETDASGKVIIWMGTQLQGLIRLQFATSRNYKIDKYNSDDGLIDNSWILPFKIDDKLVFSQRNGLLTFVDEKTIQDQLPDSLKNKPEFYRGFFDYYKIDSTGERVSTPFYVVYDTKDRIYANLDGDLGYFDKLKSYSFVNQPFCLEDIGKINVFLHEDNGICWIGGDDGLLKFNEINSKNYSADFTTLITTVSIGTRDSAIYYGYGENVQKEHSSVSATRKFILNYNLNAISLSFASPFFEGQKKMLYSYKLIGEDTLYSNWSSDNRIVFNNLRERDYTFYVRSMNAYGHISQEKTFQFKILSPWYRKPWAYAIYVILISALIYAGVRINTRRLIAINKKLESIILERTCEIQEKNSELERQKKDILDSINYALRIQNAVFPVDESIQLWLGDHFIIHRPKDIVSGDFYWTTILDKYVIFCVADCTGHGVPGAFMSMLCISLLNEIVIKDKVIHPDEILNKVRVMIIDSLKQKGVMGEQKDGMDISICVYNKANNKLEYSGAHNPLYIVRKKDTELIPCYKQLENEDYVLYEIKGDIMPISIYDKMDPFRRHSFNLLKNDRLYLFSDGIFDQFGGPDGKRFMSKSLKALLMETLNPEMGMQKVQLEKRIDEWQAFINPDTGQKYSQVDDICLMGIKI
jgi:serine phosphatase RsbU (regulator of sigma subunit)